MTTHRILAPVVLGLLAWAQAGAQTYATQPVTLNIEAQPVRAALLQFGEQAGLQVLMRLDGDEADNLEISPLKGQFTLKEGLERLLARTGLSYEFINDRTVRVGKAADEKDVEVEEIVVSARKQGEERLQEVPIPIAVMDTDKLASNNQVLLRDYVATVPSVNLALNFNYAQRVFIRGIGNGGATSPTTGIAVDDIPFGGSTGDTAGANLPDIDPGDLARIEVLRGPQGTLYGANSMGGLLRYVTVDPSTAGFSARLESGVNAVRNGDGPGYSVRGSANIPLSETVAIRASGSTRQDAGYIDNPVTGRDGINQTDVHGGKLSGMWQASDDTSLKLSALYQRMKLHGAPEVEVEAGLGDLQQTYLANIGGYEKTLEAYSALFKTKLGSVDVFSATGYTVNAHENTLDRGFQFGTYVRSIYQNAGTIQIYDVDARKLSQELRLSASVGEKLEWQLGGFYTHEDSKFISLIVPYIEATGEIPGPFSDLRSKRQFEEFAAFGALTYHFTERFDMQVGGRQSRDQLSISQQVQVGEFLPLVRGIPSPLITPPMEATASAFTYLVTPRFVISPEHMVYARFASGFRPGGVNPLATGAPSYDPDETRTYEVGWKSELLGRALSVDASVFYIDWSDIQVTTRNFNTGDVYNTNGSGAKSEGAELSITAHPLRGFMLTGWVSYTDAVLTKNFPVRSPLSGIEGDRLPFASRLSGYLSVEQTFPLWGSAKGFVGAAASYVGDRKGEFQSTRLRQDLPSYTQTDLRAGANFDSWTANLFVNNLTDERGLLNGGLGYLPTNAFIYIQPRTVGVSVARKF